MLSRPRSRAAATAVLLLFTTGTPAVAGNGRLRLKKPRHGAQMIVGPIAVPQGSEATECTYFKFPHKHDMAVRRVDIKVRGGSHHIHLYRPYDSAASYPDGHETCDFALNFDVFQLVLASQTVRLRWELPPGVAFFFRAGEQLLAQTHFVDNGLLESPPDGWAAFNLHSIPTRKVQSYAGSIFGQDRDVVVPAHSIATATTRCVFPKPVKLLGLTGHYHFRGTRFTVNSWDGVSDGESLYAFEGYNEPLFKAFGAPGPEAEVPGLSWTCTYTNDTDTTFTFGPFTDRNEHCNLFGFYYPTEGTREFTTCVQENGYAQVEVRQ